MNRFDCRVEFLPEKPAPALDETGAYIHFNTDELEVKISKETGFIDLFTVNGEDMLKLWCISTPCYLTQSRSLGNAIHRISRCSMAVFPSCPRKKVQKYQASMQVA